MKPEEFKKYLSDLVDDQVSYLNSVKQSTDFPIEDWICGLEEQMVFAKEFGEYCPHCGELMSGHLITKASDMCKPVFKTEIKQKRDERQRTDRSIRE